jgi:hypothetical protein
MFKTLTLTAFTVLLLIIGCNETALNGHPEPVAAVPHSVDCVWTQLETLPNESMTYDYNEQQFYFDDKDYVEAFTDIDNTWSYVY